MRVFRWVAIAVVSAAALIGIATITLLVVLKPGDRSNLKVAIVGPYSDGRDSSWHTDAGEEQIRANNIHFTMASQISRCFDAVDLSASPIPGKLSLAFLVNLQPNGEQMWERTPSEAPNVRLTNYERAALILSQSISIARSEAAASAASSQKEALFNQRLIIILGGLTTILVSIKSMSNGNTKPYFVVGILAVVFSATGTALSSMNSYSAPGDAALKSERALVQLRALHMELAVQVAEDRDTCKDFNVDKADDPRAKKIAEFSARLKELTTSGAGFGGLPSNPAGGGSGQKSGGSGGSSGG